nr:hypothetical protein [Tanacetum cinerariifolium]
GPEYLRKPTVTDIEKLYRHHEEKHRFPEMLGSLDCMDWEWFGCPYAFKGQYVRRDHGSNQFIFARSCCVADLWILHAFFGVFGSNNDINVLYQSLYLTISKPAEHQRFLFVANGVSYPSGYYLVDGIYPELASLVKTIPEPADDDHNRILYKEKFIPNPSPNQPFIFDIDGRTLEFGMEDFCLISGFRFGKVEIDPKEEDYSEFQVHHEVRVYNEVSMVVDKEEVHVRAVDKEDTSNRSENVPVCGLDQQSMEGASQCMNVDEPCKNWNDVSNNFPVNGLDHQPVEGVSQCTILNDEIKSVAIDGLISLRSQDVGHISKNEKARDDPEFKVNENEEASHSNDPEFKVKENEEASQSDIFLSTQQVRELINNVFDTPSLSLNYDDACVSELIDTDQPFLVKSVLDDVHIDSVVKDAEESENPRQKFPGKVYLSPYTQPSSTEVKCRKRRRRQVNIERVSKRVIKTIVGPDGNEIQLLPWKESAGATLKEVGYLVITSIFGLNICGNSGTQMLTEQLTLYLDNAEVFEKKNIDKENYSITFRYAEGVPIQGGLYGDCGICLYRLSHNIPLEVDDPISFALAYRERMIEFYWKYKMLQ